MPNIYYNGKLMETTDGRFNKKQTQFGSDPRINKRKKAKKYVHIRIRPKLIFYTIVILFILSKMVNVDMGFIDHSQAVQAPVTKVMAKDEQVATPQPQVQNKPLSIEDKIRNKFGKYGEDAVKVGMCESGLRPDNHNGNALTKDDSWGIYQINRFGKLAETRPSVEWLKDADNNINYAYDMFVASGYRFGSTATWKNCADKLGIK